MSWKEIKNLTPVPLEEIPILSPDDFRQQILQAVSSCCRVVQFFGEKIAEGVRLYAVMGDDRKSVLMLASTILHDSQGYRSLTPEVPMFHLFEREVYEQFGVEPIGHPWLKPVRHGIAGIHKDRRPYEFFSIKGDEVHEVGVGPIHAGIIEPGHFRFSCLGEQVEHLEIELGFQHRGVERLFVEHRDHPAYLTALSESIAGDTVIGHASAFHSAVEALAGCPVPHRASSLRLIMLELERIANHTGDLAALANDIAYLTGYAVFGALRTRIINLSLSICGSRFGRGMITFGGVRYDISAAAVQEISDELCRFQEDIQRAAEVMFSSPSVLARFEKTGVVPVDTARAIGMVGPAARASGLSVDVRADYPVGAYLHRPVHKLTLQSGDVMSRALIRQIEIKQSIQLILEELRYLPGGEVISPLKSPESQALVVSMVEGWRGEIVHVLITDRDGKVRRCKLKDPSFHNWFGLALAVRGNGISDFPLCNKSFNLSYCGFDL